MTDRRRERMDWLRNSSEFMLTIKEAAATLRISVPKLKARIAAGEIMYVEVESVKYITRRQLQEYQDRYSFVVTAEYLNPGPSPSQGEGGRMLERRAG